MVALKAGSFKALAVRTYHYHLNCGLLSQFQDQPQSLATSSTGSHQRSLLPQAFSNIRIRSLSSVATSYGVLRSSSNQRLSHLPVTVGARDFSKGSLLSLSTELLARPRLLSRVVCCHQHGFAVMPTLCCLQHRLLSLRSVVLADGSGTSGGGGTSGSDKSSGDDEAKRSVEKMRKNTRRGFYVMCGLIGGSLLAFVVVNGGPPRDIHGKVIEDEFSKGVPILRNISRSVKEGKLFLKMIKEPSRERLLPDPLKDPYYQPPMTLVIEMNGVLVHPEWSWNTGWRFKKRPGVDFFIQQVGYPVFEVVIYTSEQGTTAFGITESLDPNGLIMYRLFRDATHYIDGQHVKSLSRLNRDLKKVIYIDWNPEAFKQNPENALRVVRWEGSDDDTQLIQLAALLRTIATSNMDDVRPVLEYYSKFDDPLKAFHENQLKLEAQLAAAQGQSESVAQTGSLAKGWSGRLFGFKRHS